MVRKPNRPGEYDDEVFSEYYHAERALRRGALGGASAADLLLGSETDGVAIEFTTMSMSVRDTVTPANNFSGDPNSKLTYSSPPSKWTLLQSGLYASATTMVREYTAAGAVIGMKPEPQRVNVVLRNRDLSNASWTKTNVTAAKDQTGIDGAANSASSITATAGNGTCLQAITLASAARAQSAFVKRITGAGTINMTMDNGTTWTAVTVTSSWTRVTIPTQTLANPTVGFQIVTSGDAIAVDFVQNEDGTTATSPIEVPAGSSVTRAYDNIYLLSSAFNLSATTGTLRVVYEASSMLANRYISLANDASAFVAFNSDTLDRARFLESAGSFNSSDFIARTSGTVKAAISFAANDAKFSIQGSTVAADVTVTVPAFDRLRISGFTSGVFGGSFNQHIKSITYLPRTSSQAELNAWTT